MPRGRGEGGNLLRAHRFKLRNTRTALYFFTTSLQREEEIWRLLQKECLLQRWAHLRKQADAQSGSGTKYGWSERQLTNSIWNSELDSELDSKPILMGDTQNHSV